MSNYYANRSNPEVWKHFDKEEQYSSGSKNVDNEKDSKKDHIGVTTNEQKNIEDRYYGEDSKTFDNDSKYFHPSSGSKSSSSLPIFALAAIGIGYIVLKK